MQNTHLKRNQFDPQPIQGVMGCGSLHHIIKKAKTLMAFDHALKEILPENAFPHCQTMNLRNDVLVIGTNNAAIATQLRYSQSDIIQALKSYSHLPMIEHIQVKVRPNLSQI